MQTSNATARIVGALFIVATAAAVVGDLLVRPIRNDPGYLANFSSYQDRIIAGMLSEVLLAAAVIGIAAMLFPVLKRQNEGLAIGYVGARIVEATIIVVGGMSSLLLLTLSEEYLQEGASATSVFEPSGALLLAAREWTDALGPAIVFGLSALILYGLLYQSGLVPRLLSVWGFVGAVLLLVAGVLGLYGVSPTSTVSILLTLPIGVNEMALAVWLMVKGFDTPTNASEPIGRVTAGV